MTVYISGAMTGAPDLNRPAFEARAAKLRKLGYEVVVPHDLDDATPPPLTWKSCLKRDIAALSQCDLISMIPGWEKSVGACLEKDVAYRLGIDEVMEDGSVRYVAPQKSENVLQEADRLIHGPRQSTYNHPNSDFTKIAGMWELLFGWKVSPAQVGLAMVCLKLSRESFKHKRDNLVDAAGYAGCVAMIEQDDK